MEIIKRIISFFIFFFIGIYFISATELDLYSERYILYNMNDNRVIDELKSHEEVSMASLTKIMTVILAIENETNYDKKVIIKSEMIDDIAWDVAIAGFKAGEVLTYDDLLYGAMLPSGADAVQALAHTVSGNRKDFVKLMNDKVKELGLKNTRFENVVGLYSKDNYSSAYDMAQILIYALKNEKFKEVFTTREYTFSNGKKTMSTISHYNKNSNIDVSFITGSKTGYISDAGYCLASTATLNGVDYLLVTLNAFDDVSAPHIKDANKAYTYYDKNYKYMNIVSKDDVIVKLKTIYAKEEEISIPAQYESEYYLKKSFDKKDLVYEYDGLNEVSYFTPKGTLLGNVKIKYNDEVLDEFELYYNEVLSFSLLSFLWINKLYVVIGIVVLFFLLFVIGACVKRKRRKRKK